MQQFDSFKKTEKEDEICQKSIIQPELRFPEFKDNWEKDSLGNLAKINKGFTPSTNNEKYWKDGTHKWLSIADMKTKYLDKTTKRITEEGTKNKPPISKGKLVMSFKLSIGKLGILKEPMYTNEAIANFDWRNNNLDTEFMFYYLNSINILKYGSQAAKGITLNNETLSSIPVKFPSKKEQEKIASFLIEIDKKIELLKIKYQHYRDIKKYLMQQIFTQELRFPNNNSEWEWLNFEDIFKSVSTKKYQIKSTEINTTGAYEVIDQGQKDIAGYHNDESKLFKELPIIIFGDHTTIVKYRNKPFIVGADGVKLLSPKIDVDMKYMYYALNYFNIKTEGYKRHFSIIKKIDLPVPTLKEQNQISSFFSAFDEKINFIQSQIEYMEEYKKGLLQKMFI